MKELFKDFDFDEAYMNFEMYYNFDIFMSKTRPRKSNLYQSIILKGVRDGDITIAEALKMMGYNVITDMEYSDQCFGRGLRDIIEEEHSTITKESCKTWKESVKPQNKIAPKPYTKICFQLRNKQK